MDPLARHDMLPDQTCEEKSRHEFLVDMKTWLMREGGPGVRRVYERRVAPAFAKKTGHAPRSRHEIAEAMKDEPYYQMWSALSRAQQEIYVDSTAECVERQLPELIGKYRRYRDRNTMGSLTLNPAIDMPHYQTSVDIHCVPGGYLAELGEDDVYAGARYDIGTWLFGRGLRGPYNDLRGVTGTRFIKERFADFAPKRILDLGCATANNTLPYVDAFPGADVYGVDISAGCLRYAHARAEAIGKAVHLSQQRAEHTDFEDESFDLVVSHILFHETSRRAVFDFLKEAHRLLKPGGLTVHVDVGRHLSAKTPLDQFIADWDTLNNNEPFWGTVLFDMDMKEPALAAGFKADDIHEELVDARMGDMDYWAYYAVKP